MHGAFHGSPPTDKPARPSACPLGAKKRDDGNRSPPARPQLEAEKRERDAAERAGAVVRSALEAEKKLATAMRWVLWVYMYLCVHARWHCGAL